MNGLLLMAALLGSAFPAQAGAVDWASSTTVRWKDLNDDPRVIDPQFSWDPIQRAVRYEVEVNPSNDWAVGSRVCCDDKAIGTSLSPRKLLPNNTYYWRVRAIDAGGEAGRWNEWCGNDVSSCDSPAGFEKTFDDVTPTIPGLRVRDSDDDALPAAGVSGLPTTDAPVLAWDPVAGASSYELRLAPWDTSGIGFCNWTSLAGRTYVTAATTWTPLGRSSAASPVGNTYPGVTSDSAALTSGASYCVRVRARSDRDAQGAEIVSDWTQLGGVGSAAFTYQAAVLPPCGPTAMPAAAYHPDEPQTPTPRVPLFTWDRVDGACGYFVVVAKDPQFTKVIDVAFTNSPAYSPRTSSQPKTYTDETTAYYWVVMPSASSDGTGVATAPQENHPQTFNKRSVPPTPLSPKEDVSGVPSFHWSAAEGARRYLIQVDTDPNFASPVTDVVTNSTAYTSTVKYPAGTALYWRVRADDETLVGLSWSTVETFSALPPETNLRAPAPALSGSTATFTFDSNVGDATFKCKLDGPGTKLGALTACTSPATYGPLADGIYKFTVTASDLAANADPTPEIATFKIDSTVPDTAISAAPATATNGRSASFTFTSTKAGSTFECRLDGPAAQAAPWTACTSPASYVDLADGDFVFSVRATDALGHTDATPAMRAFTVDTHAPDTVIGSEAAVSGGVTFAFTGSETRATFQCRLERPDGTADAWSWCASPGSYFGLTPGGYRFNVRATDPAGNVDPSPASRTFAVAEPPPSGTSPSLPPTSGPGSQPAPSRTPAPSAAVPLGAYAFHAPSGSIRVRRGIARLRFDCTASAGCGPATFVLRYRGRAGAAGFSTRIRVSAGGAGSKLVRIRFGSAARRSLKRLRRSPFPVTIVGSRAGATPTAFRMRNSR